MKKVKISTTQKANYVNCLKKLKLGKTLSSQELRMVEQYENPENAKAEKAMVLTKQDLAARLGIARTTLDKFLSLPGAPAKSERGWAYDAVLAHIAKHAEGEEMLTKTTSEIRSLKAKEIRIRTERALHRLSVDRGEFLPVRVFVEKMLGFAGGLNAMLTQKANELPAILAGKDIPAIRGILDRVFDEMRRRMQDLLRQ